MKIFTNKTKITKEQFKKFCSNNTPQGEVKKIEKKIDKRMVYIVQQITTHCEWWDYDNEPGDADIGTGFFDLSRYKENVGFTGEYAAKCPYYESDFPTRWLWEDFEEEFENECVKYQKQQIKKKLSKEELKVISFK